MITLLLLCLSLNMFTTLDKDKDAKITKATLLVFEGSDWCGNCRQLKKKVLSDTSFINQMKENQVVIELVDFPQRKKLAPDLVEKNASLAEKYQFDGVFPTLIIARQDTFSYAKIQYQNEQAATTADIILAKLDALYE